MLDFLKKIPTWGKVAIAVLLVAVAAWFLWFRKAKPTCNEDLKKRVAELQSSRGKWKDDYDYGSAGGGTRAGVKPYVTKTDISDDQLIEYTKAFLIGHDVLFDGWTPQALGKDIAAWINSGNAVEPAKVKLGEYACK